MNKLKYIKFIEAYNALFLFKHYTIYSRWFEIGLGIIAWCLLFEITFVLFKIITC